MQPLFLPGKVPAAEIARVFKNQVFTLFSEHRDKHIFVNVPKPVKGVGVPLTDFQTTQLQKRIL